MPLMKRTETITVSIETVETVRDGDHEVVTETKETTQHVNVEEHFLSEENVMRGQAPGTRNRLAGAVIYLGVK